ncbi:MFS transporter [Crenobacter caeni]|uniref:MFS transporter n=1 Tax=Crenobacter caeni TaxID=2705474 RepID=A0A6B2KT69_9NEIS|nr:MFS transporter [Crenobacter caeni]NDV13442.1 MFS transporter [Crenobacter caeni]
MQGRHWLILWVAFLCGVLATFAQFAVPPVMPALFERYGISYTEAGLLMSMFAIATLLFATPCGFIIPRYGVRNVGLAGLLLIMAGLACTLYAGSFAQFVAGRAVQGIGFGLVAVSAPTAIGQFLPADKMPVAMGIWSTWIPVGNLIVFFAAPRVLASLSIEAYWVLLIASMVPGVLLFALVIPNPPRDPSARLLPERAVLVDELKNTDVWAAALTFAAFTFGIFSLTTWSATYLNEVMGLPLVLAVSGTLIYAVASIASDLYGGVLLHKFGHRRAMFVLPPTLLLLLWPLFAIPDLTVFCVTIGVFSLISGVIPPIVFASAPLLARRPQGIGVAMAIVIIGENLGFLIGPQVFGWLREVTGTFTASFWAMGLGALLQIFTLNHLYRTGVFARRHAAVPALAPASQPPARPAC